MTEWWQWATWIVGIVGGLYGAWRSWRTERRLRILDEKWRLTPVAPNVHLVENRLLRTAYGVRVTTTSLREVSRWPESSVTLRPGEAEKLATWLPFTAPDGPMVITWHHRRDCSDTAQEMRAWLPPAQGD